MQYRTPSLAGNGTVPFLLASVFALTSLGTIRADNIDEELLRRAPQIMKYLKEHRYASVGVLPFTFQRGDSHPSFSAGLINQNMAARVENALVLALNPEDKQPIGVITNVGAIATRKLKGASYNNAEERARLFSVKYPLAWGDPPDTVTADVMLGGKVTLSSDLKKTKVLVAAFSREAPSTLDKVTEFEIDSDRFILTDAGQGFSLSKGKRSFRRDVLKDEDIFSATSEDEKKKVEDTKVGKEPTPTKNPAAASEFPVELRINYDRTAQEMRPDPDASGYQNWLIGDPQAGQKVTFTVRNKTDATLGIVLAVNGINTLHEEMGQPDQMLRWVLEPGKEYTIKGYYRKDKATYKEIEGIAEDVSSDYFAKFGPLAGYVHLFVFRPAEKSTGAAAPGFSRSLRRMSSPTLELKGPAKTPADLQARVSRGASLKGGRGLMAWGANEVQEDVKERSLGEAVLTDTLVIRYFKKP